MPVNKLQKQLKNLTSRYFIVCCEQFFSKKLCSKEDLCIFAIQNGALTQLARVSRWQRGSHRFESDMLHKNKKA